jgi:hypothetical protein
MSKIQRNDKCPCGSGLKYKHCCLNKREEGNMKEYIGVKIIKAEPFTKEGEEGYKVRYQDGYESWSPKAIFQEAYRVIEDGCMTFGLAIEAIKKGFRVARKGWNGKDMFIVYMPPLKLPPFNTQGTERKVNDRTAKWIGEDAPLDCQPYIAMYNAQKQWIPGWVASQSDMLSEDWYVVRNESNDKND